MILPDDTPPSPSKLPPHPLPAVPESRSPPPPAYSGRAPAPAAPVTAASYSGYSSYQTTQPIYVNPSTPTTPLYRVPDVQQERENTKRARRRFVRAFLVALIVYLVVIFISSSLYSITIIGRRLPRTTVPYEPTPEDGKLDRCVTGPIGWEEKNNLRVTTYKLPLSADGMYVFTRGVGIFGNVKILQDTRLHNKDYVEVEVGVPPMTSDRLGSLKVCSLERKAGHKGVGIFSAAWYPDAHPVFHIVVTIRIPKNHKPVFINSLETNMPNFSHELSNVVPDVTFGNLTVKTSNERIGAKDGLLAHHASLQTNNAGIEGIYSVYDSVELITENSHIEAAITLHNGNVSSPTRATLKTSNARLATAIYMYSEPQDDDNGAFDVSVSTLNGPLALNIASQPLNSTLNLAATSKNSLINVYMHPAFEGQFNVQSTNGRQLVEADETSTSPDGDQEKRRDLRVMTLRDKTMGSVVWMKEGEEDGEERRRREGRGKVEVKTTNGPALLKFM